MAVLRVLERCCDCCSSISLVSPSRVSASSLFIFRHSSVLRTRRISSIILNRTRSDLEFKLAFSFHLFTISFCLWQCLQTQIKFSVNLKEHSAIASFHRLFFFGGGGTLSSSDIRANVILLEKHVSSSCCIYANKIWRERI